MTGLDIASMRERLGLTQTQLASILGVHYVTVSRWETGHYKVPPYHVAILQAIANNPQASGELIAETLATRGAIAALYTALDGAFDL